MPKTIVFNIQKSHFSLWARTNLVVPLLLVGLLKLLKPFGGSWRLLGWSSEPLGGGAWPGPWPGGLAWGGLGGARLAAGVDKPWGVRGLVWGPLARQPLAGGGGLVWGPSEGSWSRKLLAGAPEGPGGGGTLLVWTPRQPPGPGIQLPGTRGPPGGGARQTPEPKTLNRPEKGLRFGVIL